MALTEGESSDAAGKRSEGEVRRLAWILLTALIATLPLLIRGNSCGHDFDFHLQSWLQVADQWRHGIFYPHWVTAANYGAGEPRLVFYPPASWMLGALLGTLLPWKAVGGAFVLIAFVGAGLGLYALAREWLPRDAAALAACIYIVNPYAMFVAYERTAYGELLAAVWIPLILLFALKEPSEKRSTPPRRRTVSSAFRSEASAALPLAVSVAAIWLTNAPAAVMASYLLAIVAAIAAVLDRRWWPVLRGALGAALGLGLAAFYIVPAAFERRWVDIARALAPGMRIEDNFLFSHTGDAFHDQVLHTASWIALAMLLSFAAAAITAWRARSFARTEPVAGEHRDAVPRRVWVPLLALPVLILMMMLRYSDFLWRHTPELRYLQFPWRWLLVVSVSLAVMVAMVASRRLSASSGIIGRRPGVAVSVGLLVVVGALVGLEQRLYWQPCDEEDMVSAQVTVFQGGGLEGTDEYTTPGTDSGGIQQGLPAVRVLDAADADEADSSVEEHPTWSPNLSDDETDDDSDSKAGRKKPYLLPAALEVQTWNAESKQFTVSSAAPGFAVLRLLDYPAWGVRVNGVPSLSRPHREDGLMTIPVGAGLSSISVHYVVSPDVRWGRAITLAALVVVLLLALRQRRNRP